MKIDLTELKRHYWFEDCEGHVVEKDDPKAAVYRYCFPLTLYDEFYSYDYHPKNPIVRLLCRNHFLYRLISKNRAKTFRPMAVFHTTYGSGSDCIVAMVNSGDYTLEEAIWVYAKSCERCMNALCYKYLYGADGYPEHSEEWNKCNTVCDFCREEDNQNE